MVLRWSLIVIVLFAVEGCITTEKKINNKPNIIFFLIDDLGWKDLSCQGSKVYETPNIDELASQSMRFENAYSAHPRCVPSRYGILTGNYPARGGVPANREHLKENENTFAMFLRNSGYTSCYIGKWHLGDGANSPVAKGFNYSIAAGAAGSPRNYFAPYNRTEGKKWKENKTPIPDLDTAKEGEYLNDRLTTEAIRFIDKNRDSPFFLMMAHYAVHEPLQAPDSLVDKFKAKIENTVYSDTVDYISEGTGRTKMKQDNPIYAAMLSNLDYNIGRVISFLKSKGLYENTIIIFTSDHGGLSNDGTKKRFLATSNRPLRAGKGWLYEGGIRVPLFIKWDGVADNTDDTASVITGIDFYPTIAEMVTGEKVKSDGESFLDVIKGKATLPQRPIFWYSPKGRPWSTGDSNAIAVRYGNYKLIDWYESGRVELYNLNNDIGEHNNLADSIPTKRDELLQMIKEWEYDCGIE